MGVDQGVYRVQGVHRMYMCMHGCPPPLFYKTTKNTESRKGAGLMAAGAPPPRLSAQDVIEFIFFPVINEACRVIEEGIVDKPADLDVATVMAMGFPPYRGGLVFWADLVGAKHIVARLEEWEGQLQAKGMGGFFKPCVYLKRAAVEGTKLSAGRAKNARM